MRVTFSLVDLLHAAHSHEHWDALLVAYDVEHELGVLQQLRSGCLPLQSSSSSLRTGTDPALSYTSSSSAKMPFLVPSLVYCQFEGVHPEAPPSVPSDPKHTHDLRWDARSRGYVDFCKDQKALFAALQVQFIFKLLDIIYLYLNIF